MSRKNVAVAGLLGGLIVAICLAGFSEEIRIKSQWAPSPPKIDGTYNDWLEDTFISNDNMHIDYAFMNDSENLYILFKFNDPKFLSSINATGIKIWFSTEKKGKKDFGIRFVRKQVSASQFIALLEKQQGLLTQEQKESLLARPYYFLYIEEFVDGKDKPLSGLSGGAEKPAVFRLSQQQTAVVYEFSVSIKTVLKVIRGLEFDPGKPVSVGFEWGGITKEMRKAMAKRGAAWESGAEEGTASFYTDEGGERRTRGAGDKVTASQKSTKKYSFWVVVDFALTQ